MLAPEDEGRALDALRFSLAGDIVELVVLTTDDAFLKTLREAGDPTRRLWHVLSPDKVSDLLLAGGVGILVLDVHALNEAPARFILEIKRQFPDLVVVVAGHREAETELARLISAGSVYRFIHKPVSPARARLFAEAAVRRYEEQRRRADSSSVPAPASPRNRVPLVVGAGCAAGCVLLVSLWLARRPAHEEAAPASGASRGPQAPATPASSAPVTDPRELWLARAENALLEDRLDEAAGAIEAARMAGASGSRLAFLSARLAKARDRARSTAALARTKSAAAAQRTSIAPVATGAADSADTVPEQQPVHEPPAGAAAQDTRTGAAAPGADPTDAERWAAGEAANHSPEQAAAGHSSSDTDEAAHDLTAAAARQSASSTIVDASQLEVVTQVAPTYPVKAEKGGIEGWVELDLTITETGGVEDVTVHAANPAGVFDQAAVAALSRWRYKPVFRDSKPVATRARIRIRFALPH